MQFGRQPKPFVVEHFKKDALWVGDYWSLIVAQNELIGDIVLSETFYAYDEHTQGLKKYTETIYSYNGVIKGEAFIDDTSGEVN